MRGRFAKSLLGAAVVAVLAAACTAVGHGTPTPSGAGPTVVTFGDSVPAGTGCGCSPFPDLYARRLSPAATSVNLAEPGSTSADVRQQMTTPQAETAVRAADVVLVMAGANDIAAAFDPGGGSYPGPAAQVQRNIAALISSVRAVRPAVPVLVLGYWNVVEDGDAGRRDYGDDGAAEAAAATTACDTALMRAAATAGARYIDTTAAFKGDTGDRDPTELLTADGDHPNAAGQQAIADAALR